MHIGPRYKLGGYERGITPAILDKITRIFNESGLYF